MAKTSRQPAVEAVIGEDEKGRSLWSHAWRRLRRNKIAMISAVFIFLVAASGYSSCLISRYLTHFSPDETHTKYTNRAPGTADLSIDYPTYDGNKDAFKTIDLDGDGVIRCSIGDRGQTICPELQLLEDVAQGHFDFLFDNYDKKRTPSTAERFMDQALSTPFMLVAPPAYDESGVSYKGFRPDGFIIWDEFPKTDDELEARFRGLGLAGPDAFRKLDVNGDNAIANWEVTEQTRALRFASLDKVEGRTFRPFLRNFDANKDNIISLEEFPGAPELHVFYFGTDGQGRDVLTRLFYGAAISITIALLATLVSLIIGVSYGSISGYFGGRVDNIMMRIVDIMYGLPFMFIVILIMVMAGRSIIILFIVLGAVQWLSMARVVRGQVISLKTREFVEAARAIGVSRFSIVFRHLIRNAVGPVVVYSTLLVPAVILEEAFLSFLGFGVELSWGKMIAEGKDVMRQFPWQIVFPGAALALTLFAMNFLGDGVRDAIDPKQGE